MENELEHRPESSAILANSDDVSLDNANEYQDIGDGKRKDLSKNKIQKKCDLCGVWITLGGAGNSDHSFHQHRNGTKCQDTQRRNAKKTGSKLKTTDLPTKPGKGQSQLTGWLSAASKPRQVVEALPSILETAKDPDPGPSFPEDSDSPSPGTPPVSSYPPTDAGPALSHDYTLISDTESEAGLVMEMDAGGTQSQGTNVANQAINQPSVAKLCNGIRLPWPSDDFTTSYPWAIHKEDVSFNVPFTICRFDGPNRSLPRARHENCTGTYIGDANACTQCIKIPYLTVIKTITKRSISSEPGTPYNYLSHAQVSARAHHHRAESQKNKLLNLNASRRIVLMTQTLSDYERLLNVLMSLNAPQLKQLLLGAIKSNFSISRIIQRISDAALGLFHTRTYTEQNIDILRLVHIVGGAKLAYAVQHALGLPSISTAKRHSHIPAITPPLSIPSRAEVESNIRTMSEYELPPTSKRGHNIMIDELAIEEQPRYSKAQNAIIGLCREHSQTLNVVADSLVTVERAAAKVRAKECHIGKEATVAVIGAFSKEGYKPQPLVVSATCKIEEIGQGMEWIQMVEETWHNSDHGERIYGPVWSYATDGDPTRRNIFHSLACKSNLPPSDPLYNELGQLLGFNLLTGVRNITVEYDPRHLAKRFRGGLIGSRGTIIGRTEITTSTLRACLLLLPDMKSSTVDALLNPADHQNVPLAVTLLQSVSKLRSFQYLGGNPSIQSQLHALSILGHLYHSFIDPMVDVTMSLQQQLECFATASHLLVALYRKHGTSFISGQLYYDTQATIKSIFFTVAKQRLLDPNGHYYVTQTGTDRLENMFGDIRTQKHDRNCDLKELCGRLGRAQEMGKIFAKNTTWDRGHKRLKLVGAEGIDFVNPGSWKGDVSVKGVKLDIAWKNGCQNAEEKMKEVGVVGDGFITKFSSIFTRDGVDMCRPWGGNRWPGISDADADWTMPPGTRPLPPLFRRPRSPLPTSLLARSGTVNPLTLDQRQVEVGGRQS